jgi:hypothetical protein
MLYFLPFLFTAVLSGPTYIVDQAGSTPEAFPYTDLHRWGVRQVVGGGVDCSSYLRAIPGGPWYDAAGEAMVAKSIAANRAEIDAAHAQGMQIFLTSDLFQFPTLLLKRYASEVTWPNSTCYSYTRGPTCIDLRANATQVFLRLLFDEVKATFPTLDGLVLRYGENSPCAEHQGNAPFDTSDAIPSLQRLLVFLREELCVRRNLTVLFRTWDTSTQALHANASFYAAVVGAVQPHPRLVFSIKHTALDFWRRTAVNPTLGVGAHGQVVEAEVAGMYFACGSSPLYIGHSLINGYAENSPPVGLQALFAANPALLAGVLTNHQCPEITPTAPYFWPRLEQGVISAWAANPAASEEAAFLAYAAADLGLTGAPAAALRALALAAMDAHLKMWTVAAFDPIVNPAQLDRPTANWLVRGGFGGLWQLDPTGHEGDCHAYNLSHCMVFPFLGASGGFPAALAEKEAAAAAFSAINSSAYADVAPALRTDLAQGLRASTELGAFNAAIAAVGWRVMALGWQGEKAGVYNVTGLRQAIAEYDRLWGQYRLLPGKLPGYVVNGSMMSDRFWVHPSTGQPGMGQSVDKFRGV